ncbi:AAA family ATPase [Brachybacterium sp. AOP3-A1-3]|uniref:AAA family ATPase n=1 Tax=Brachybacterium sp. AOP3-A1-3 TaxID=3457699 RepID=UPI004034CDF7
MHPHAAARARLAAMEVVRSLGLEADEIVDLQDSNRLTVRVLPCDLVARIGPADHAGAQVEVDRVLRLAEAGAPVGRLDPRTPPQVHVRDGFEITLWTHYAPREDRALPAGEYAGALARLHAAMRAADLGVLPVGSRVAEALALVDDPVRTPRLPEADRAFLRETLQSLGEEVTQRGPQQVLHGEPHPGNVLDTADGPLFIDLETCCTGPVEFDLAHAPGQVADHYPGVDTELLEDCRILSRALVTTWRWDHQDSLPDGQLLGIGWLDQVRTLMAHRRRSDPPRPTLTIVCGLPGSGKTTVADRIVEATGAARLSPDDWMARLGSSQWDEGLRERIEQLQWQIGQELLQENVDVVIEWGTWGREERDRLREGARALGARVELLVLDADDDELWRRISARAAEDPPITREHLAAYRTAFEVPTADELALYDAPRSSMQL